MRGLLGHTRIETTQLYAQIRPAVLKQAVEFYEAKALDVLSGYAETGHAASCLNPVGDATRTCSHQTPYEIEMVAPTGFEPVFQP